MVTTWKEPCDSSQATLAIQHQPRSAIANREKLINLPASSLFPTPEDKPNPKTKCALQFRYLQLPEPDASGRNPQKDANTTEKRAAY